MSDIIGTDEGWDAVQAHLDGKRAPIPVDSVERVREQLRSDFMRVQRSKRDGPIEMQPVWDIINAVPSVLHVLDGMGEFERDIEAERLAALTDTGEEPSETMRDLIERALPFVEDREVPPRTLIAEMRVYLERNR